jgi:hypothetical protein
VADEMEIVLKLLAKPFDPRNVGALAIADEIRFSPPHVGRSGNLEIDVELYRNGQKLTHTKVELK